jgi:glycosyltransferase involved in cell wall biosynthesis
MPSVTLIVPFYRNALMLAEQVKIWNQYPADMEILLVDDGSPEPAMPIFTANRADTAPPVYIYRILEDVPWNRGGARNLGSHLANTDWLIHIDIDHVLLPACARSLVNFIEHEATDDRWYRFPRYRRGAADDTRKKDALDPSITYGPIKPHCDSYLVPRNLFWKVGGYDEDYSGCLGGGSPFLKNLESAAKCDLLPPEIYLEVYTRSVIADASDFSLSRDTSIYSERRRQKEAKRNTFPKNPLRFNWKREL